MVNETAHMFNTIASGLASNLPGGNQWVSETNDLCAYLGHRWTKDHLIATCFRTEASRVWSDKIQKFSGTLLNWRFGESAHVTFDLLDVKPGLVHFWCPTKLKRKVRASNAETETQQNSDIDKVTRIIRSELYWQFTALMNLLLCALMHFNFWCEACPCHPRALYDDGDSEFNFQERITYFMRRKKFKRDTGVEGTGCVRQGCQCAYLAAGKMDELLQGVMTMAESKALMLAAGLRNPRSREGVLQAWNAGRAYIAFMVQLKFGFFQLLPHVILVLAHDDLDTIRRVLQRAYVMYLSARDVAHNFYVNLLFSNTSPHFAETRNFINGGPMTDFLKKLACKFMWIKNAERSAERPHRLTHMETDHAPNHSPAYLSSKLRAPEFRRRVSAEPVFLQEVARHASAVRNPMAAARVLGLDANPILAERCPSKEATKFRTTLVNLTYRTDPRVQYERFTKFQTLIAKARRDLAARRSDLRRSLQPVTEASGDEQGAMAKYAFQHLQQTCNNSSVFTLKCELNTVTPFTYLMNVGSRQTVLHMRDDEVIGADPAVASIHGVVFRVVVARPASLRFVESAGFQIPLESIAIQRLSLVDVAPDSIAVSLTNRAGNIHDLTHILTADNLLQVGMANVDRHFKQWVTSASETMAALPFENRESRSIVEHLTTQLIKAKISATSFHWENGSNSADDERALLEQWEQNGFVRFALTSVDLLLVDLTDKGVESLGAHIDCKYPQAALARRNVPIADMTTWDLFLYLREIGWRHEVLSLEDSQLEVTPYACTSASAVKTWYTIAGLFFFEHLFHKADF